MHLAVQSSASHLMADIGIVHKSFRGGKQINCPFSKIHTLSRISVLKMVHNTPHGLVLCHVSRVYILGLSSRLSGSVGLKILNLAHAQYVNKTFSR